MALAVELTRVDNTRRNYKRIVKVTASGNYANSGTTGDVIDFTGMTNPNNLERAKLSRVIPDLSRVKILNHPPGWVAVATLGAAIASNLGVRFFQSDDAVDPLDELANGAYPASISDNPIYIEIDERN